MLNVREFGDLIEVRQVAWWRPSNLPEVPTRDASSPYRLHNCALLEIGGLFF